MIPLQPSLSSVIEQRIQQHFSPIHCHIQDDSHEHAGHAGSVGGGKHFSLTIHSPIFLNTTLVQRHKMVYAVLNDLLDIDYAKNNPTHGYIHALKLDVRTG
jgi:BolA family transcriptional regulator, general stress-responsive regulator